MIDTKFLSDRTRAHIWGRLQSLVSYEAEYKIGNTYLMRDAYRTFGVNKFWALFVGDSTWRLFLPSEKDEMKSYMVLSGMRPNTAVIESNRLNLYPKGYSDRKYSGVELMAPGFAAIVKNRL